MRIRYTATTLCGSGYLQSAFLTWIRPSTQNANPGYKNGTQLGYNSIYAEKEKAITNLIYLSICGVGVLPSKCPGFYKKKSMFFYNTVPVAEAPAQTDVEGGRVVERGQREVPQYSICSLHTIEHLVTGE